MGGFREQLRNLGEELRRRHALREKQVCPLGSRRRIDQSGEQNDRDFWLEALQHRDEFCPGEIREQMIGDDKVNIVATEEPEGNLSAGRGEDRVARNGQKETACR